MELLDGRFIISITEKDEQVPIVGIIYRFPHIYCVYLYCVYWKTVMLAISAIWPLITSMLFYQTTLFIIKWIKLCYSMQFLYIFCIYIDEVMKKTISSFDAGNVYFLTIIIHNYHKFSNKYLLHFIMQFVRSSIFNPWNHDTKRFRVMMIRKYTSFHHIHTSLFLKSLQKWNHVCGVCSDTIMEARYAICRYVEETHFGQYSVN